MSINFAFIFRKIISCSFKKLPFFNTALVKPCIFNYFRRFSCIFRSKIFYFIIQCVLYNYADDNTLSFIHKEFTTLKSVLEQESQNLLTWFENNFMKANPDKFQAICIGRITHDHIDSFQIGQTNIKCEDSVTLLGINIDYMLKFDEHVSELCKKASKQLAVLKRLGGFLSKQGKLVIYNSFIASNFSYCPLAWHFCSASSTNKLEKVQERALRFINNDFSSLSQRPSDFN